MFYSWVNSHQATKNDWAEHSDSQKWLIKSTCCLQQNNHIWRLHLALGVFDSSLNPSLIWKHGNSTFFSFSCSCDLRSVADSHPCADRLWPGAAFLYLDDKLLTPSACHQRTLTQPAQPDPKWSISCVSALTSQRTKRINSRLTKKIIRETVRWWSVLTNFLQIWCCARSGRMQWSQIKVCSPLAAHVWSAVTYIPYANRTRCFLSRSPQTFHEGTVTSSSTRSSTKAMFCLCGELLFS